MTYEPLDLAGTFAEAKARAVQCFEAAYLEALLRHCGGNLAKASRQADIARNHLRDLLKRRGLYKPRPAGRVALKMPAARLEARLTPKVPRPALVRLEGLREMLPAQRNAVQAIPGAT